MKDIQNIDKNFQVKSNINKTDIKFISIEDEPFKVYGVFKEKGKFRRIPEQVAKSVSEGVYLLHANTSGGRVRFKTDSSYVAIRVQMDDGLTRTPHFALSGSAGFDLYEGNIYRGTYAPSVDCKEGYEGIIEFESRELRDITINFPLYSNVTNLYIGIQDDSSVEEAPSYKNAKPIVYYGSSITQGGCASRPGMSYPSIISRKFDCDYINLGFSGNAKAEDEIIEYIKSLDMSVFIYDYDHNAPSVEHLMNTHEKMFKAVRNVHPEIPVIMMSRPKHNLTDEEKERRSVVEKTYNNAIASGDNNVYFIDGAMLTELCMDDGTVDNCHQTDFGFVSMANALAHVIETIGI